MDHDYHSAGHGRHAGVHVICEQSLSTLSRRGLFVLTLIRRDFPRLGVGLPSCAIKASPRRTVLVLYFIVVIEFGAFSVLNRSVFEGGAAPAGRVSQLNWSAARYPIFYFARKVSPTECPLVPRGAARSRGPARGGRSRIRFRIRFTARSLSCASPLLVPVPVKRHRGEPGHTRDTHRLSCLSC